MGGHGGKSGDGCRGGALGGGKKRRGPRVGVMKSSRVVRLMRRGLTRARQTFSNTAYYKYNCSTIVHVSRGRYRIQLHTGVYTSSSIQCM